MLAEHLTVAAATVFFVRLINAIPTTALLSPYPDSVLYSWSTEPVCATTAKKTDCTLAYTSLCARPDLTLTDNSTVGDCTAFYWYDTGNTIPTAAECTAAYQQVLATSIGGALGYNAAKNRTNDPLYAVYPKDGNANCFKAAGDTSPVLGMDALPGGRTLPTCPASTSRRRRALGALENRGQAETEDDGVARCGIEDGIWSFTCSATCLVTVTAATWITGPFVAAGWLACLGGCSATGWKVYNNCQKAMGHTDPDSLLPIPFRKREEADDSVNPCVNIKQWTFQCPAQERNLLSMHNCQQTINT